MSNQTARGIKLLSLSSLATVFFSLLVGTMFLFLTFFIRSPDFPRSCGLIFKTAGGFSGCAARSGKFTGKFVLENLRFDEGKEEFARASDDDDEYGIILESCRFYTSA